MDGEDHGADGASETDRSREALAAAKGAGASEVRRAAPAASGAAAIAKIGVVMVLLGGAVAWLLLSNSDVFVYSHMVDEVMAAPDDFQGRTLRVEGDLVDGTVRFREDPCEYRFSLARGDHRMDVDFPQCIVPDTFREGMGISVVVEGRIGTDGAFHATQVIPRCPSRYEMEQRRQHGESMPHGAPPPRAAL